MGVKYFDAFAGIGGFSLGIQQANKDSKCVGYSEIDKYASAVYQINFPKHKSYGDITKIDWRTAPDFDLLTGGFPCQSFSIAGKRGGFDDVRGTLFFELAKALKEKRPKNFIFENVKGLLSHDNGDTFKTIIATLAGLGYGVEWQVLNSKNFGVPQNRERVYIIGHLGGIPERQVFPIRNNKGENNEPNKLRIRRKLLQGNELQKFQRKETQAISKSSGQGSQNGRIKSDNTDSRGAGTYR